MLLTCKSPHTKSKQITDLPIAMPKMLCIMSLVTSALVLLLFLLDLIVGFPFGGAGGILGHLGMIFGAAVIGTFSVLTFIECR